MASLYVSEQGATVRKEANRLVVERDGRAMAEVHDFKVERVVVFGSVQVTTQAMAFLLDRGIDTAFLTVHGRLKGRLAPVESRNAPLRIRQYERSLDPTFALGVARGMVAGKIANCSEVLSRQGRNHGGGFEGEVEQLSILVRRAERAPDRDRLFGLEGQSAAVYFKGFARALRRGWNFSVRTRRPPTDPVNSLLSFGYALLYNEAIAALSAAGFDPCIGFLHALDHGRCSLALDLMEEMRPLVADRLALNLANMDIVKAEDFTRGEDGGVFLGAAGRKRFLAEYERLVTSAFVQRRGDGRTTLRDALHGQALALRRVVMDGEPYRPFRGWH